jgi:predicted transcriptional regulator
MTFTTKYPLKTVLTAISETQPRSYKEIAERIGCTRETVRNILQDYEVLCESKELQGDFVEWKIKREKVGKSYNVIKVKQLTEEEVRAKEIAELKRLMGKYPEVIEQAEKVPALEEENEKLRKKLEELETVNTGTINTERINRDIKKKLEEYETKED